MLAVEYVEIREQVGGSQLLNNSAFDGIGVCTIVYVYPLLTFHRLYCLKLFVSDNAIYLPTVSALEEVQSKSKMKSLIDKRSVIIAIVREIPSNYF